MLGPFTFTFTLESEEFEKSEKVGFAAAAAAAAADLYQTMITTRAPDGANKSKVSGGKKGFRPRNLKKAIHDHASLKDTANEFCLETKWTQKQHQVLRCA